MHANIISILWGDSRARCDTRRDSIGLRYKTRDETSYFISETKRDSHKFFVEFSSRWSQGHHYI